MSIAINVGGVWKNPTPWINVAGTWKRPTGIFTNVSGTWKKVWAALSASLGTYSRSLSNKAGNGVFSGNTCTVTGNSGTVSYQWDLIFIGGDDGGGAGVSSGQGTNTCTVQIFVPSGSSVTYSLVCTVTADGNSVATPPCTITYTDTNMPS